MQNLMSGCGFVEGQCGFSGPFIFAWVGILFLILVFLLAKKWLGEEGVGGLEYNWLGSIVGILAYVLLVSFGMGAKWALLLGLGAELGGGFGLGAVSGGSE